MTDDVFADWKDKRFLIVDAALIDITDDKLIVLTDIEYWNENYSSLESWCEEYGAEVRGMTVTLNEQALTAFCLRW